MITALLVAFLAPHATSAVLYVSAAQTNNVPDGASWPTAFKTVQEAILAASYGDTVWVAAGTYFENLNLSNGVALYGGFNGTETDLSQRNSNTNFTILDGRQSNSVVIIAPGATNTTRVDGFTIRNGRASYGGGVFCANASPLLLNNRILFNQATNNGGGIYCSMSSPLIASNLIQGNVVSSGAFSGAGIGCASSGAKIQNNRIIANSHFSSSPYIAGAIFCDSGQSPEIINNFLLGNTAQNSAFIGEAGGIRVRGVNTPRIINNTILWCKSEGYSGGISCDSNSAIIVNNLVAFCSGGINGVDGMTFKNNCVFGNGNDYTGFTNPTGTKGNISIDPQLATNSFVPDVHILPTSPCRDTGDGSVVQTNSLDIDGDPRIVGAAVDIGADEFTAAIPVFTPLVVRVSTGGADANDGSSWAQAKRTVQAGIDAVTLSGGEVWVSAGVYNANLTLRQFVFLYGGFTGSETNRAQRDWASNPTVLDGNHSGSVIIASALQQWNAIDGFVIRNGSANLGAAIYCSESAPIIAHNLITNNATSIDLSLNHGLGGALYCFALAPAPFGSSPVIVSNVISFNRAKSGGAICTDGTFMSPIIANNRIEANFASVNGPSIVFVQGGGGIFIIRNSNPTIAGNFFLNNIATNVPGSSYSGQGGAICIDSGPKPKISNNTFIGNSASGTIAPYFENGGGIYSSSGSATIANNIIAFGSSGLLSFDNLQNNCVYGNISNYLRMPERTGTNGNISINPSLISSNDYHLTTNSPCINAGNNLYVTNATDFDGNPRIVGSVVDIGVHEVQGVASVISFAWLQQYGLPTDGSADFADTDGDGASNWLEWQGGSNPTNALSLPWPMITAQPISLARVRGINATFAVSVLSVPPASYQWQFNGTNLSGANGPSLTITNVQAPTVGAYRVIVTNSFGTTLSSNALLELGTIALWGANGYGQSTVPFGATNTSTLAGGDEFCLRLTSDGVPIGWGLDAYDQFAFPPDLSSVIAIAAGNQSTLALRSNGTLAAFGIDSIKTLPDGLTNVVALAVGWYHAMALKADGKAIAWGFDNGGDTVVPQGLSNVVAIACGWIHSLALKADGTVAAWGDNSFGQTSVPVDLTNATAIAVGQLHSLALKADGTVVAWGSSTPATNVPAGLSNVVAIASGSDHCLALRADGTVIGWGQNGNGQADVPTGLSNVVMIACGWYHSLALVADGPPLQHASIGSATWSSNRFSFSLPTQNGRVFRLEQTDSLSDANWLAAPLVAGTGRNLTFTDSGATNSQRFYRVRRW